MLTSLGEAAIDLIYLGAVVVAISCLVYLCSLVAREHRELRRRTSPESHERVEPRVVDLPAATSRSVVSSPRTGAARRHVNIAG
jgi:hypothetical protein